MSAVWDREEMIRKAENLVRTAAEKGAQVVLLQELFETPYFCQRQDIKYLDLAVPLEESRAVKHFQTVAEELRIVIPVSFFERYGNTQFNTVAMIDGTGNSWYLPENTYTGRPAICRKILFYTGRYRI